MKKVAIFVVMAMAIATVAGANLVVNGDWSTGDETGWTRWAAGWGSGETWTVDGGNGNPAPAGVTDSTTDSASFGWYQVITTPPVGPYTVSADWEGDVGSGGWAEVMFFTVATGTDPVPAIDAGNAADIAFKKDSWGQNTPPNAWGWEAASLSPAAGGNNGSVYVSAGEDLVVATKTGNTAAVYFDNIVVVPEPATVLLGLTGLAVVLRRRRR